jgi:hypothetical protein
MLCIYKFSLIRRVKATLNYRDDVYNFVQIYIFVKERDKDLTNYSIWGKLTILSLFISKMLLVSRLCLVYFVIKAIVSPDEMP